MKEFFIQHTEKLVLGLSALIAVYFLYSALTVQQYDKTPQDFQDVISRASQTVRKSEPKLDDLPPLNFETDLEKLKKPVDGTSYQLKNKFVRPLELGFQFRGTPSILPPGRPEAMVNRGLVLLQEKEAGQKGNEKAFNKLIRDGYPAELIWFLGNEGMVYDLGILPKTKGPTGPANNEELNRAARDAARAVRANDGKAEKRRTARGVTWVEIVAAFPHADQIREYIKSLKEGAEIAGVRYALAEVQRQELTESLEWTPWERIGWEKQFDLFNTADKLDNPVQDIPSGVVPGLVMHAPERAPLGAAAGGIAATGGSVIQTRRSLVPDLFLNPNPPAPKWTPAELDPRAAEEDLQRVRPKNIVVNEDGEEVDVAAPNAGRAAAAAAGGGMARTTFSNDSNLETVMVRAFDFTAESGKRYRYRVRAVLFNPNFNRPDVLDPDDAMKTFLVGEWSEPSDEVYVEPTTEMMLAENKTSQADRAQFSVYHWLAREGRWVSVDSAWFVGQVVGTGPIKPIEVPHYDPKDGKITKAKQPIEGFDTNIAVLDVSPAQIRDNINGLDFTIQPPKEVVVVNQFGDLIHRKELNDLADAKRRERDTSIQEAIANPEGGGVRNNAREKPVRPAGKPADDGGDLENPAADSNN